MEDQGELKEMDPLLAQAVCTGNLVFLREALTDSKAKDDYSYFHCRSTLINQSQTGNIFHIAIWKCKVEFFREAMEKLPTQTKLILLTHQEPLWRVEVRNSTPFHLAAYLGRRGMIKTIISFFESIRSENDKKPWLWTTSTTGETPLHLALCKLPSDILPTDKPEFVRARRKDCALELLASFHIQELCEIDDNNRNSPLFLAVEEGFTPVALKILKSGHSYSVSGRDGFTPLHFAPNCSEEVCKLILEKHPELIKEIAKDGSTIFHTWSDIGHSWPFECLLNNEDVCGEWRNVLIQLISSKDKDGDNPLHIAALEGNSKAAQILVDFYNKQRTSKLSDPLEEPVPWLIENDDGHTPLDLAIREETDEDVALCFLSPEINSILKGDENPLFLAIEKEWYKVAEGILDIENQHGWSTGLTSGHGRNVLHGASHYKEEVAKWLVQKLPSFIAKRDMDGKTPLDEASEKGADWLVELMLHKNSSSLKKAPLAWVRACEKGHLSTVLVFINNCPYFRDLCYQNRTTPLHHIQLEGYHQYEELLNNSLMRDFLNFQDLNGATPLHQAIRKGNIHLAEQLLAREEVDRNIIDEEVKTAKDLLEKASKENLEWAKMCRRHGIVPGLRTSYLEDKTDLLEARNTLSVVAALLATITFTAGFTLPGGFDSDNGEAILAKKVGFVVFLLSDTYAMCCSMLVLFCLIWSMVCEGTRARILIDRSLLILLQSLYGTFVAFMTGVYVVISHKTLWAAIVIIFMCCAIVIVANRTILHKILDRIILAADSVHTDEALLQEALLQEEGRVGTLGNAPTFRNRALSISNV